ncbi:hypothetical protein PMAYCL1PPCAC_15344, partial [Pristionchus mayeri]
FRYYLSLHSTTDKDEPDGWRCLIDEYNRKYGRRIENAWIVLDHWAAVPLVFVHVPTLIMVNFPLLRVHDTGLLDFCTPMYTCYPVLDAVLPILLISEYRRGLLGVMRKMPVVQVTSWNTSTSV